MVKYAPDVLFTVLSQPALAGRLYNLKFSHDRKTLFCEALDLWVIEQLRDAGLSFSYSLSLDTTSPGRYFLEISIKSLLECIFYECFQDAGQLRLPEPSPQT